MTPLTTNPVPILPVVKSPTAVNEVKEATVVVMSVPEVGSVTLVVLVVVKVSECPPDVIKDPPLDIVKVAELDGGVIVTLLIDVAVATPKLGVVKDGLINSALSVFKLAKFVFISIRLFAITSVL